MENSSALRFPEMRDAVLSAEDIAALRNDLRAHAVVTSVMEKGAAQLRANSSQPAHDLEPSIERLLTGEVRAIQVRYAFDGHDWTDTLMRLSEGFRLVRCRHDAG